MSKESDNLKERIRKPLPIIFGEAESIDRQEFKKKLKDLVSFAANVSGQFLSSETVRYQAILLNVTLVFVSVSLLKLNSIKLGESVLAVDEKLTTLYAVFIILIAVIFLVKAHVDFLRFSFTNLKDSDTTAEVNKLIQIGSTKKIIQEYFWLETFDAIGKTYKEYDDRLSARTNSPANFKHIPINILTLNLDELRKQSEFAVEIQAQEYALASLKTELEKDVSCFQTEADAALAARASRQSDPILWEYDDSFEKIQAAYNSYLGKWFDARNELNSEHFKFTLSTMSDTPEIRLSRVILSVVKRPIYIRRINALLEIYAPVAFALGSIIYALYS